MSINVIVIHEGVLPEERDISRTRVIEFDGENQPVGISIEGTTEIAESTLEAMLAPEMRTRLEREQVEMLEAAQATMLAQAAEREEREKLDLSEQETPIEVIPERPNRV